MMEIAALLAGIYILAYLLFRRRPARIVIICPLHLEEVPEELVSRLGTSLKCVEDVEDLVEGDFRIGYLHDGPGIAIAEIATESMLEDRLGPYLESKGSLLGRRAWLRYLSRKKWRGFAIFALTLNILHTKLPRSLTVDFRRPTQEHARRYRISRADKDIDLGMYAYEILSRLRRYSRYRGASCRIIFQGSDSAWRFDLVA